MITIRPFSGQRGINMLETLAAIALIAIFSGLLLQRLFYYQKVAERAAVEGMISLLASGMRIQASILVAEGKEHEVKLLDHQNPFRWLDRLPATYQGGWPAGRSSLCEGCWYFDASHHEVIYLPKAVKPGVRVLRYSVIQRPGTVLSVALVPLSAYDWGQ